MEVEFLVREQNSQLRILKNENHAYEKESKESGKREIGVRLCFDVRKFQEFPVNKLGV